MRFEEVTQKAGNLLNLRKRKRAGSIFVLFEFAQLGDISGDGALDLIAYSQPMRIYTLNNKIFEDITNNFEIGKVEAVWDAAIEDFNGDGQSDIYFVRASGGQNVAICDQWRGYPPFAEGGPHELFQNRGNENHWLMIDLEGTVSNRDGIGAHVLMETEGVVQRRVQSGGMHSFAQNHQRIHFGLGNHADIIPPVL